MDEKPNLTLVKSAAELRSTHNIWRCCKEASCIDEFPQSIESPWWINSSDHHFCFWRYVKDKSDVNGVMRELVQSELAELFSWSNTKTHFMLKQAIEELTVALKQYGAGELLEDFNTDDTETLIVLDDFVDLPSDESIE